MTQGKIWKILAFRYSENVAVKCSHPDADNENLVSIKQGENKTGIKDTM